jgi:hypothetical protein
LDEIPGLNDVVHEVLVVAVLFEMLWPNKHLQMNIALHVYPLADVHVKGHRQPHFPYQIVFVYQLVDVKYRTAKLL